MEDINKLIAELEARAIEVIKENTELKKELQALKKELENKKQDHRGTAVYKLIGSGNR